METTAKVLETMRSAGKPVSAGEVATLSGLDRTEVGKAFHRITFPLQVAAGIVRSDLQKTGEEAIGGLLFYYGYFRQSA